MADLLKQCEGTDVKVYTHGEMLPCHAYPELKKSHTMAHTGRPWTDHKPPAAAPVWAAIEGLGRYYILLAALELDVFDTLQRTGPSTVEALADELGILLLQDFPLQWGYARSVRGQAIAQAEAAVDEIIVLGEARAGTTPVVEIDPEAEAGEHPGQDLHDRRQSVPLVALGAAEGHPADQVEDGAQAVEVVGHAVQGGREGLGRGVQIADPALQPKSRPSDRRQVRRNLEDGFRFELVPGRDTNPEQRAGFLALADGSIQAAFTEATGFAPEFDEVQSMESFRWAGD